jgi:hypothetical protein
MSKQYRLRLSAAEKDIIDNYRNNFDAHAALKRECDEKGIPIEDVRSYWWKGDYMSINVSNNGPNMAEVVGDIMLRAREYAPKYPKITYKDGKEKHLLVIDPSDIHLNKLARAIETGDEYNHEIAFQRVKDAVIGLLNRSSGYSIEKILFVTGNDILHVDTPNNTTTSGTHQDSSLMWYDAFKLAQKLMVDCIELLIQVAPTHVVYNPSNHDRMSGFYLLQTIDAWFSKCDSVTFDITPAHRKYYRYWNNLIGTSHGDGAKEADLPLLMAHESKDWSDCKHKYFYTHHIHHKKSKDYMGVTVESMRSPSGADSWHHRSGYQHAPKGIDAFIHHPIHGQVARLSYIF